MVYYLIIIIKVTVFRDKLFINIKLKCE